MIDRPDPLEVLDQPPASSEPPAPLTETAPPEIPPPPPPAMTDATHIDGIPVAKYMAIRDRERAAQLEIQQLRAQLGQHREPQRREMPDPLTDPQGYAEYIQGVVQSGGQGTQRAIDEYRYNASERDAARDYGRPAVEEAFEAFKVASQADPMLWHGFHRSADPWGEMVQWHQRQTLLSKIGDDPDAWVERRYAELQAAKALAAGQPAPGQQRAPNQPPAPGTPFRGGARRPPAPSLSNAPPSGVRTQAVAIGPSATFDSVFKP
jgi:hypothetical protein